MTTHNLDHVAAAHLQTHNTLQRLTYLLESKGLITAQELAAIHGEDPEQAVALFRAGVVDVCAIPDSSGPHVAHTTETALANKGIQGRAVDSLTSADQVIP